MPKSQRRVRSPKPPAAYDGKSARYSRWHQNRLKRFQEATLHHLAQDRAPDPADFLQRLNAPAVCSTFARYQDAGGDPKELRRALLILWPQQPPPQTDQRTIRARATRCAAALQGMLDLPDLPKFSRLTFTAALKRAEHLLALMDRYSRRFPGIWRHATKPKPGRPRAEASPWGLVPAAVALELEHRLGPLWDEDLLTILRAVNPQRFGPPMTAARLRRRVSRIPKGKALQAHDQLFSTSLPEPD